jgi:hypothetical protein
MDTDALARILHEFLADARAAVIVEDGLVMFEMARTRYSVTAEHGRCLLHLWSEERNAVRRVLEAEHRGSSLRLEVLRFGQVRPSQLDVFRDPDRRTASARKVARVVYRQHLRQALERTFREWHVLQLSSSMDLGHSFGPLYTRGLVRRGHSAFAVLGVGREETQASADAALTFAILWMNACRESLAAKAQVEGVKLVVPRGASQLTRARMSRLNPEAAKWQLYELDEREGTLAEVDCSDAGNLDTHLVRCPDQQAAHERFGECIARITALSPAIKAVVTSAAEISFRIHGLTFAHTRIVTDQSFRPAPQTSFGVGAEEMPLTSGNAAQFEQLVRAIVAARTRRSAHAHPFWRMHAERWLESRVLEDVCALEGRLDPAHVYSQVPAFSAADRAMVDVLTSTRDGRLAVIELKADEDIHLPLQGLDYWGRVQWHHARGEFQRSGYFPGRELASSPPLLLLVVPALHIHPATDTLLRYLSPEVDWTLVAINERWRDELDVIFRKSRGNLGQPLGAPSAELTAVG